MPRPSLRDALLDAGLAEFHAHGYTATGVSAIARRAGGPKGSFYNHFASKEELALVALGEYGRTRRLEMLAEETVAPPERIRAHFSFLRDDLARHDFARGCLFGTFAAESGAEGGIGDAANEGLARWVDALAEAIDAGRQDGSLAPGIDPRRTAAFLVDAWEGATLRAKASRSAEPVDNVLELMFGSVLDPK